MSLRFLRAGETDHESIWLAVSTAVAGVGALWLRMGVPVPPCAFHLLTGYPCPTCGVTRAIRRLLHGDLPGALHFNPLAVCGVALVVLFDLYAAAVLTFHLPRLRFDNVTTRAARRVRATVASAVLLNWLWLFCAGV